jgi:uncharacterized protein
MQLIHAEHIAPQAWRNGGGQTRELLAHPAGADWHVRVSLADIRADGPFSAFPGVQRWFTVVQGPGVRLSFAEGDRLQREDDAPLNFDGARAPGCTLLNGPTRDLNLMLRGVTGTMSAALAGATWEAPHYGWRAFFSRVPGRLVNANGGPTAVPALTLLSGLPGGPCHFEPDHASEAAQARVCGWWLGAAAGPT